MTEQPQFSRDSSAQAAFTQADQQTIAPLIVHIVNAVPLLLSYIDRDQRYRFVNRKYEEWFGSAAAEIVGRSVSEVIGAALYARLRQYIEVALTGQSVSYEHQVTIRSGEVRSIRVDYVPHLDSERTVLGLVVLTQDITEEQHTATALRGFNLELERQVQERTTQLQQALEFESLFKRITDKVRDSLDENQILQTVVEELGRGLQVECCDTALYDIDRLTSTISHEYTVSVPSVLGKQVQMLDKAEIYDRLLQAEMLHLCLINNEYVKEARGGKAVLACPIVDDQRVLGDLWLFKPSQASFNELEIRLVQQIANQCAIALRQARLYEAAQQQVEELEKLNRLKDDFLNTVSHELRTPLANIRMATQLIEMLLRQTGLFDQESTPLNRYVQILHDECQRETNLVNDLLDLSRLEAKVEPFTPAQIDPRSWIAYVTEPFIDRAHSQQQHLEIELPAALPPLTTDSIYLERILRELLTNACKYTPPGGMIWVSAQTTAGRFEIRVTNSGVVVPAAELSHIFDKFYRIPSDNPWEHGGTGLGLALVKKLTEQLGATIRAESTASQLSFILELPCVPGC